MKYLYAFLTALAALLLCAACTRGDRTADTSADTETPDAPPAPPLVLWENGATSYTIRRADDLTSRDAAFSLAITLRDAFRETCGGAPKLLSDFTGPGESVPESAPEILIGKTNRPESAEVFASLEGQSYAIRAVGQRIVVAATDDAMLTRAVDRFIEEFITPAGAVVPADTDITYSWDGVTLEYDEAHAPFSDGVLTVYPVAACYTVVDSVAVTVNGRRVPLIEGLMDYDYCSFSLGGAADVSVTFDSPITSCTVSPLRFEIPVTIDGSTASFRMDGAEFLILTVDDRRRIVLAADKPETDVPDPRGSGVRCVTLPPYGADPSGVIDATAAIQRAVDDAFSAGGGTVYVPEGVYSITQLHMRSHVAWYLAPGAVLRLSEDLASLPNDYTRSPSASTFIPAKSGMKGTFMLTTDKTKEHEDIRLYGRGTIDGRGNALLEDRRLSTPVHPVRVTGFTMEGILVRDGAHWSTMPTSCDTVLLRGTKHLNEVSAYASENDAIDIVCTSNVTIDHVLAVSEDDAISVKNYSQADLTQSDTWMGTDVAQDCCHIVVKDCLTWSLCGAMKIGWGVFLETSDVLFQNCTVYSAMTALSVAMRHGGGIARDITFEDIDVERYFPRITPGNVRATRLFLISVESEPSGGIRDVTFRNINARAIPSHDNQLKGVSPNGMVDGVLFSNFTIRGRQIKNLTGLVIPGANTQNIRLEN